MGDREPLDIIEDAIRTGNGIPLTPRETAEMVITHLSCNGLSFNPVNGIPTADERDALSFAVEMAEDFAKNTFYVDIALDKASKARAYLRRTAAAGGEGEHNG